MFLTRIVLLLIGFTASSVLCLELYNSIPYDISNYLPSQPPRIIYNLTNTEFSSATWYLLHGVKNENNDLITHYADIGWQALADYMNVVQDHVTDVIEEIKVMFYEQDFFSASYSKLDDEFMSKVELENFIIRLDNLFPLTSSTISTTQATTPSPPTTTTTLKPTTLPPTTTTSANFTCPPCPDCEFDSPCEVLAAALYQRIEDLEITLGEVTDKCLQLTYDYDVAKSIDTFAYLPTIKSAFDQFSKSLLELQIKTESQTLISNIMAGGSGLIGFATAVMALLNCFGLFNTKKAVMKEQERINTENMLETIEEGRVKIKEINNSPMVTVMTNAEPYSLPLEPTQDPEGSIRITGLYGSKQTGTFSEAKLIPAEVGTIFSLSSVHLATICRIELDVSGGSATRVKSMLAGGLPEKTTSPCTQAELTLLKRRMTGDSSNNMRFDLNSVCEVIKHICMQSGINLATIQVTFGYFDGAIMKNHEQTYAGEHSFELIAAYPVIDSNVYPVVPAMKYRQKKWGPMINGMFVTCNYCHNVCDCPVQQALKADAAIFQAKAQGISLTDIDFVETVV